jgi:hypothetical protein
MASASDALADIARAVHASIQELNRREAAWAEGASAPPRAAPYAERLRATTASRDALAARTEAITGQMALTDDELGRCETELRLLAEQTETLRRKLAAWAGRAIG